MRARRELGPVGRATAGVWAGLICVHVPVSPSWFDRQTPFPYAEAYTVCGIGRVERDVGDATTCCEAVRKPVGDVADRGRLEDLPGRPAVLRAKHAVGRSNRRDRQRAGGRRGDAVNTAARRCEERPAGRIRRGRP